MVIDSHLLAKKSRISTLKMITKSKSSHVGSSFSVIDLLAVTFSYKLNENRTDDSIILSKGHAAAGLYSILGNCKLIPDEAIENYGLDGSAFGGHTSHFASPHVEFSTGSLGHALSIGAGIAKSKLLNSNYGKVFVIMSDGELNEGSSWEAFLFASHHKLHNVYVLIDRNNLQSIKSTEETLALEPLKTKFEAFGWYVSVIDGHNHDAILKEISNVDYLVKKPRVIICNTVKGKGVSFMENDIKWHYKYPNPAEFKKALEELI